MCVSTSTPIWIAIPNQAPSGLDTNQLGHLRRKRLFLLDSLRFLVKCKNNSLIPNFIRLKLSTYKTPRVSKALHRAHLMILRSVIKDTRTKLAIIEDKLYHLHLQLSNALHFLHWNPIDNGSFHRTLQDSFQHNLQLNKKFTKLKPSTTKMPLRTFPPAIVNLSNQPISNESLHTLQLGLNCAVAQKPLLPEQLIAPLERAFKHSKLHPNQLATLRLKVKQIIIDNSNLDRSLPVPSSLTHSEISSLQCLSQNKDIFVTRADKGGQTAIIARTDYNNAVNLLISNGPYRRITCKRNPVLTLFNKTKKLIDNATFLNKEDKFKIKPKRYNAARLYALPKLHKNPVSYRPIISCIGMPTAMLSAHLASIFSPLLKVATSTVKNSVDFINKLKLCPLNNNIMISLDVTNMFTNVPISEALQALKNFLYLHTNFNNDHVDELLELTHLCLNHNYFSFNKDLYQQTEGMAMGNSLSGILCDIFMYDLDHTICNIPNFKLEHFFRYVDDIFSLFPYSPDLLPTFLKEVNSIHPKIQFTLEIEINNSINFLDVTVTINRTDQSLLTQVYRKPCSVPTLPHSRSAHPLSQKISSFYSFVYRALNLSSNKTTLNNELNYLKQIAQSKGFNPSIITQAVKKFTKFKTASTLTPIATSKEEKTLICLPFIPKISSRIGQLLGQSFKVVYSPIQKIKSFLPNPKDPIPTNLKSGIYKLNCSNCNLSYIGQTKRCSHERIGEHRTLCNKLTAFHTRRSKQTKTLKPSNKIRYTELNFRDDLTKSSIAQHCLNLNHTFDFNNPIFLANPRLSELDNYETINILRYNNSIVNGNVYPHINPAWINLFNE